MVLSANHKTQRIYRIQHNTGKQLYSKKKLIEKKKRICSYPGKSAPTLSILGREEPFFKPLCPWEVSPAMNCGVSHPKSLPTTQMSAAEVGVSLDLHCAPWWPLAVCNPALLPESLIHIRKDIPKAQWGLWKRTMIDFHSSLI